MLFYRLLVDHLVELTIVYDRPSETPSSSTRTSSAARGGVPVDRPSGPDAGVVRKPWFGPYDVDLIVVTDAEESSVSGTGA